MHWIALSPPDEERAAWGWRALQFTPRAAWAGEALLIEVESCARLWGGVPRLLRRLVRPRALQPLHGWAQGPSSLVALALLRLALRGTPPPAAVPDGLPLDVLDAALPHVALLERMGCRRWGELRALPRSGVARRFGAPLLDALDAAWNLRPERYPWIELPESFDAKLELVANATSAPELGWAAQRLLVQLQAWLAARQRGVLAFELEWTHDLRRLNGTVLPRTGTLPIRTARPTQAMAHLRRLVNEQLARTPLAAPVDHLRLRSLDTAPWGGIATSLLPEDQVKGERLHEFIERVSVRLGEAAVQRPEPGDDHRPERMQRWIPAREVTQAVAREGSRQGATPARPHGAAQPDALFPAWLLDPPQRLQVERSVPLYEGEPLRRLTRLWRVETAWWEGRAALRDYFLARSPTAGLVWIYREQMPAGEGEATLAREHRWFLQGFYA